MAFQPAVRQQEKARIGIAGPSGSGKTYSALLLASGLGGKIGMIDTEHRSSRLYAGNKGIPAFDVLDLGPPYSPERFIEALKEAVEAGYDVVIIDSASPEWNGTGGCLEINEQLAGTKYRGNTWSAWSETTPRHRKFIDAMLAAPVHLIVTMRSKTETAQVDNGGKKSVIKLGMKAEQRDGIEYEMTTFLDLSHEGHHAIATKDRSQLWANKDPSPITVASGAALRKWLDTGEAHEVAHIEPPAPRLTDADRASMLAGITAAGDLKALKSRFTAAYGLSEGDDDFRTAVIATKDERKAALDAFAPENKRVAV